MTRYTIPFGIFLVILCNMAKCQQNVQFSHNMFNNMGINPGFAGIKPSITATLIARQQWVGLMDEDGSSINPKSFIATITAPLPILNGGVGLGMLQDELGFETNLGVSLAYSYHIELDYGTLGIGASINFLDKRIDFGKFRAISENDPVLIGTGQESAMMTDFGLGIFYTLDDRLWAGLSLSQLTQSARNIGNSVHKLRRFGYISAGYNYKLKNNPAWLISPSMLIKTDLSTFQADLNAMLTFNNRFWGGVSFRPQDAFVIFLGLNFEQFSLGYSYDITLSPLGRKGRSSGSHELFVQYSFELELDKRQVIHRNVRFL